MSIDKSKENWISNLQTLLANMSVEQPELTIDEAVAELQQESDEYPIRINFDPIGFFKIENLLSHLKEAIRLTNCHNIISIGSGNGVIVSNCARIKR